MRRNLLFIGHSYCVGLNRRIPHWTAKLSSSRWDVTVAAPTCFPGDLSRIVTAREAAELPALQTLPVHLASRIHFFFYGRGLRALLNRPWDLIYLWEEPFIVAGGEIAALAPRGIPLIYYTCQNVAKSYPPPFRQIERFCFRRSNGWLAIGRTTLEAQLARGFTGKPCDVISPGVDTQSFCIDTAARNTVRQRLGWDNSSIPIIGYTGRFVEEKGLLFLLTVLDGLKLPWRALFVGGGPLQSQLESWGLRYGDRVRIINGIAHADMPAFFNALDLLCLPSQTTEQWREQFGRVIIEAFACGVPVIGSRSGEIPFVIEDAGIIVEEGNRSAWIAALETLLDDTDVRARLGDRARDLSLSRHSHPAVARRHLQFFEQILMDEREP
jgi:phosphatidyl-myo-inositol dimannoside synthase